MELRMILGDRAILKRCDQLVSERIPDKDRAEEVAQEIYLDLLERDDRQDWTEESLLDAFKAKINAINCRMKRLLDKHKAEKLTDDIGIDPNYTDDEVFDIISRLHTNLRQTACLFYQGLTVPEIATIKRISPRHVYRQKIAIQEALL